MGDKKQKKLKHRVHELEGENTALVEYIQSGR